MDFSKTGELIKAQQEAMKIQKKLENTHIESEENGLVITMNGKMKAEKVDFESHILIPGLSDSQKKALEQAIRVAINKGLKKSQEVAAEQMQGIMGQMGFGDSMGKLPGM